MAKTAIMKPLNSIIWVSEARVEVLSPEQLQRNIIGEKAFGLSSLPAQWTLPFFVLSDDLIREYKSGLDIETISQLWENSLNQAAMMCGITSDDLIIVRSNAHTEGLEERGQYTSVEGTLKAWPELVKKCVDDVLKQEKATEAFMPLIIQQRVKPLLYGHISNERRVAEEFRDWKGEIDVSLPETFSISLRNWRSKLNVATFVESPLLCPSDRDLKKVLSIPCSWATNQKMRVHFEWIFDGECIYLVQADEDLEKDGVDPTQVLYNPVPIETLSSVSFPQCLHLLERRDAEKYKEYLKIQNPLLYQKLGLSIAPLYILDDELTLSTLKSGKVSSALESDLNVLTTHSLIIRTDINTTDNEKRQLLPRTSEIRCTEDAIVWLKKNYSELRQKTNDRIIFVFHNYIPAVASAFAYSSPNDKIVRIEALWGLPEGLYYYSHDKFVVDTGNPDISKLDPCSFKISKSRNYKKYFVYPMKDGNWEVQTLAKPYDWNASIQDDSWIFEIASITRTISEAEASSVSVMWFVGVDNDRYGCNVFPWFHERFEYDEEKNTPRNKLSFEKTFTIHTLRDIEELESQRQKGSGSIRNILIQPTDAQILREKTIIDRIGQSAQEIGANIILEGGILSHAYYQLMRTGAKVEVRNTFWKTQSLEHNKLVRDRIPEKIEQNGEAAVTARLEKDVLASLLKRKLVEESLEVLDAETTDDLITELADVLEVIDGMLLQYGIDLQTVLNKKEKKKTKAGGFEKGIYLRKTSGNDLLNSGKIIVDRSPVDINQTIAKSTDLRKYSTANESFTRVKVPVTMDKWEVRPSVKAQNIDIIVRGERKQGILQFEISVFEEAEQLSLFDK